jgi:competence protein ComEA
LETLPGIGPSLAEKIISYREEKGPFQSLQGLMDVSGIGDSLFENIKNDISLW